MRSTRIILLLLPWLCWALMLGGYARAAETRRVEDQTGRLVVVLTDPERVVSLAPSVTEIMYTLGQGERLVGATRFSDYPPAAKQLPRVGTYVRLDLERIVALEPDLCIAVKDGNPKMIVDRLERFSIPVYAVDPRSLQSIMEAITRIGSLLGAEQRAMKVVHDMRTRIRTIAEKSKTLPGSKPKVFYQIGTSPMVSVGEGSYIHELITLAGGINIASGRGMYPRFSREEVLALAPDIILVSAMRSQEGEEIVQGWSRFPSIPAVRDGQVQLVDTDLFDRPSPRLVLALEQLFRIIHPELAGRQ